MESGKGKTWDNRSWLMLVVTLGLAVVLGVGCNHHQAPVVRYGDVRLLAQIPDGARRRTATVKVTIRTADGKEEAQKLMAWAAADVFRLPVGAKNLTLEARDASGSIVYRASEKVEVVEGRTADVPVTEWEAGKPEDTSRLAALATLGALLMALALGGAKRLSLAVLLFDHKWLVLPISLVAGFGFATVVVLCWQGAAYLSASAMPSLWMLAIPFLVAYGTLLEFRFCVFALVPLDSAAVAALIGIAAGIGCLALPMIAVNGWPWTPHLGLAALAAVGLQVYLHERF